MAFVVCPSASSDVTALKAVQAFSSSTNIQQRRFANGHQLSKAVLVELTKFHASFMIRAIPKSTQRTAQHLLWNLDECGGCLMPYGLRKAVLVVKP